MKSELLQLAYQIVDIIALGALPVLGAFGLRVLHRMGVNKRFTDALSRAAGQAYSDLVSSGAVITDRASLAAAVASGVSYMETRMPDLLAKEGVTRDDLRQIVTAEFGKLLAADPSASVTPPPVPAIVSITPPAGTTVKSVGATTVIEPGGPTPAIIKPAEVAPAR
jgi:hypothetical protein